MERLARIVGFELFKGIGTVWRLSETLVWLRKIFPPLVFTPGGGEEQGGGARGAGLS